MNPTQLKRLVDVAAGREEADLLLRPSAVANVFTGELEQADIAIVEGLVAAVGRGYKAREVHEVSGVAVPGLVEGHVHVESSMMCPGQLAAAVAVRATAGIVADPHEIANVMGLEGVKMMLEASRGVPVEYYFTAPSCVPASHLQQAGAQLGPEQLAEMASWEGIVALGEVMNFPGVVNGDETMMAKLGAWGEGLMDGHSPGLGGAGLNAYIAAGPESDHECVQADEARQKLARGMWIMLREGSAAANLEALAPIVTPFTERRCMLVSDDLHPLTILEAGHMDRLVRRAIEVGIEPMAALRMASLNPARRFGLRRLGAIAPGYKAHIAIVDGLKSFNVLRVYHSGQLVAEEGNYLGPSPAPWPSGSRSSVHIAPLQERSFTCKPTSPKARVIGLVPGQILTTHEIHPCPTANGMLAADPSKDIALLAVVERHRASGRIGRGLVRGLGLREGALATTVAHDCHNLLVAGIEPGSMLTAATAVAEAGGGMAVAVGERVIKLVKLPIAGLMSELEAAQLGRELEALARAAKEVCSHPEPFMALSFLALEVIPELKITDKGLVDVGRFRHVELFVE